MGGRVRLVNDIEILQEMLILAAQVPLQHGQGSLPSAKLTDKQSKATVTVKGIPRDSVVIRAEVFVARADINGSNGKSILEGTKGERKRADFVIVSNGDKSKWIVCIEMQAGDSKTAAHVEQQLKGAQCFVSYCKCIGRSFWGEENFLEGYEYRFISMTKINIRKKKTSANPKRTSRRSRPTYIQAKGRLHDIPHAFLKVAGSPDLHLSKLISDHSNGHPL